jgi:hypothetical protein
MKKFIVLSFLVIAFSITKASAQMVYASEKGDRYHTADCNLSGDARDMRLETAKKGGKKSCAICKPEDHFKDKTVRCTGTTADGKRCKRMTGNKAGKCYQHKPDKK